MVDRDLLKHSVERMLNEYPKYRNVQANQDLVVNACIQQKAQYAPDVRNILERLIRERTLTVSALYADSMQRLAKVAPEYFPSDANENIILGALGYKDPTIDNVVAAVKSVEGSLGLNAYGQQRAYDEQQKALRDAKTQAQFAKDDEEADAIIAELLQPYLDEDGNLKRYRDGSQIPYTKYANRKAELEQMSIVQLRAEIAPVREAQRVKGLSAADLRKEIGGQTTTQKLQHLYDKRFAVMDPRGYQIPGSVTLENIEAKFVPWTSVLSLLNQNVINPDEIRRLIRLYGNEQFEAVCSGKGARQ